MDILQNQKSVESTIISFNGDNLERLIVTHLPKHVLMDIAITHKAISFSIWFGFDSYIITDY